MPLSAFPSFRSLCSTSPLFSFRTDINGSGWTPLHRACDWNRDEIALFLIRKESERVAKERQEGQGGQPGRSGGGQQQDTPSYNIRSRDGDTAVFWTESPKIVEEMVKSFPDLELEDEDGRQLLEKGENGLGILSPLSVDSKCEEEKRVHLLSVVTRIINNVFGGGRWPHNLHK